MKKHVMMYGIVVLSFAAVTVLSGCGQSRSAQDASKTLSDNAGVQKTDTAATAQKPDEEELVQKQLQFAESYMASAKKGLIPYAQPVAICRDIIKNNPGTTYETYARQLLREVPEDQRDRYKITNEELGM